MENAVFSALSLRSLNMKTALVQWDESLATGIDWQDMQHQQLLRHLHDLYYALFSGKVKDELDRVLPFLEHYADKHLSMEAEAMWEHDFEETKAHLKQHELFQQQLDDVKRHLADSSGADGVSAAANLCMDLNNWFARHIGSFDQRLGAFLMQKIGKEK